MKLKEITQKLKMLDSFGHPIIFLDNDTPNYILKYRKSVELPISFHDKFNFELNHYMDKILDLEIIFISDDGSLMKVYLGKFRDLMMDIERGKPL